MGYYGHCVGMDSGSLSTDLKQSYEHVSLSALGGEAVAAQFNLKVLRAACALYSGLGGITFQEVAVRCSWCLTAQYWPGAAYWRRWFGAEGALAGGRCRAEI
ncbi:unnamed protein product [Prorocentrum cordatum]|uniref:Uncharacterized protein n=1 Tax=Prorocentrum cordatum TaxID=2364126 RepID=A0ABN9YFV4_9DINO|nr:unnamed protein product [Polarella glacialis]